MYLRQDPMKIYRGRVSNYHDKKLNLGWIVPETNQNLPAFKVLLLKRHVVNSRHIWKSHIRAGRLLAFNVVPDPQSEDGDGLMAVNVRLA